MAKIKGIVRDEAGNGLNGVTVRAHRSDTGAVLGETVSSAGGVGDPLEDKVALRVNFNGGAVDTSVNSLPLTLGGGAVVVAADTPEWGDVLDCTAAGDDAHVSTPVSAALRVTGAFCLEFRLKMNQPGADGNTLFSTRAPPMTSAQSISASISESRRLQLNVFDKLCYTSEGVVSVGVPYHFAATRDTGGVIRLFLGGALVAGGDAAQHTTTGQMPADAQWDFGVSAAMLGFARGGRCVLDDIVLTIGSARYDPAGFTPPAEESTPGVPGVTGAYEITTSYTGEAYAVGIAPAGPARNHSIIRVVPG